MKISLQTIAIPTSVATFNVTDGSVNADFRGCIVFGGEPTAEGTTTANADWSIGACDMHGRNVAISVGTGDATSGATSSIKVSATNCWQRLTGAGSLGVALQYSAALNNGVTLTTAGNVGGARLVNFLMFAGADIEFAVSSAALVNSSPVTVTHNLSGTPECVLVFGSTANASIEGVSVGGLSVGFFDGTNSVGFAGAVVNAANPTHVAARCGTANMGEQISQTPADAGAWSISAVGSSTLSVARSFGTGTSTNVVILISWRHVSGVATAAASAFANTTPASTGSNVVNTGMATSPLLWLNVSTRLASTAFANDDTSGSWGFAAAVNNLGTTQQAAIGTSFQYNVSASSVAKSYNSNTTASQTLSDAGAVSFASMVLSWNLDGITETVSTAGAGQRINLAYGLTPPPGLGGPVSKTIYVMP